MPQRKALSTIHLQRDGQHVVVAAGTTFDFTADELKDIKRLSPDALRMPVNEGLDADELEAAQMADAKAQDDARAKALKEAQDRSAKQKADLEKSKNAPKPTASRASDL